jgi:hypothetical protein
MSFGNEAASLSGPSPVWPISRGNVVIFSERQEKREQTPIGAVSERSGGDII